MYIPVLFAETVEDILVTPNVVSLSRASHAILSQDNVKISENSESIYSVSNCSTAYISGLIYICSAQSENRYNSGIVLRKVGILTLWYNSGIVPVQF